MMGTGPFAVPTFRALCQSPHDVCLLVTRPPVVSRGRTAPPAPMRVAGEEIGIEIFDPVDINDSRSIERLKEFDADLLVVCDYGQILSDETLESARLGGINLHGSLLPRYRGAAPVQWSVYNGDSVTGVSVIHMTARLDGGPVIGVVSEEIGENDTAETLEKRLSELGVPAVLESIAKLEQWDGESKLGIQQDPAEATKAPRLKKAMGAIDWGRSAVEIRNQIRAFQPWPGCFTSFERSPGKEQRAIIAWVEVVPNADAKVGSVPGTTISVAKDHLWIQTGDGVLSVTQIQPVGKRVLAIDEFLRGYPISEGLQWTTPG